MKVRKITSWVLVVLLAALFGMAASGKLTGVSTEMFARWGYPAWFAIFIGVLEALGAIGLLIPSLTRFAVYGLTVIMLGASYTHLVNAEGLRAIQPLVFILFMWAALYLRDEHRLPIITKQTETAG